MGGFITAEMILCTARRFDVVLAPGHLIKHSDRSRRLNRLPVCRNHLADHGLVVVKRYGPDWVLTNSEGSTVMSR